MSSHGAEKDTAVSPSEMMSNAKRTLDGLPIYWTDGSWVTHSCQRAEVEPGVFLVWTDCGRDVPPNAANTAEPGESVSCTKCRAIMGAER